MLIIIAHRILIGTAICFGLFYTVWEVLAYRETRETSHLMIALITAVVTVAMGYYLKNLRRFVSYR
ncbi:MAG TPA: hypothetical protein VIE44_19415 [Methylomirabilota bacterium]